jgi:hypothetical protein
MRIKTPYGLYPLSTKSAELSFWFEVTKRRSKKKIEELRFLFNECGEVGKDEQKLRKHTRKEKRNDDKYEQECT